MRRTLTTIVLGSLAVLLALPLSAAAQSTPQPVDPEKHEADSLRIPAISTFAYTQNMHPMGYSPRVVPLANAQPGAGIFNSDLAFWGKTAYHGTYEGFRTIDITEPDNPVEINNFTGCVQGTTTGNQGDVIIWENVLVRSWNSPTPAGGRFCGDLFTPAGQEGVHIFDVSDPTSPDGKAFVATPCGSHTATGVPDLANNRLLVYNSPSSGAVGCRGLDIIEVPLDDPAAATYLRFEPSGDPRPALPNLVTIDSPSSAAGTYGASGAAFGPTLDDAGIAGNIVLVNDGSALPTEGCGPLVGFPAGAIALVDRGTCGFVQKVGNAQVAGATAVIVANNVPGTPGTMGGTDPAITIPSVMVSQTDGATIKAGLPSTGRVS
ncbi:MAG: PA domain-containing protein, partial [Nocardioidaceae bacterium]